jgi:hypothetical protein
MKGVAFLGIILAAVGVIALIYQGINYTSRDTVVDIGPLTATAEREHTLPLSPLFGVGAIVGGVVLVIVGSRKRPSF